MRAAGMTFTLLPRDAAGLPVEADADAARIAMAPVFTGPMGPAWRPSRIDVVVTADGAQDIALPASPLDAGMLAINGLLQRPDSYTVEGTTLTLPADLTVMAGDTITFIFSA